MTLCHTGVVRAVRNLLGLGNDYRLSEWIHKPYLDAKNECNMRHRKLNYYLNLDDKKAKAKANPMDDKVHRGRKDADGKDKAGAPSTSTSTWHCINHRCAPGTSNVTTFEAAELEAAAADNETPEAVVQPAAPSATKAHYHHGMDKCPGTQSNSFVRAHARTHAHTHAHACLLDRAHAGRVRFDGIAQWCADFVCSVAHQLMQLMQNTFEQCIWVALCIGLLDWIMDIFKFPFVSDKPWGIIDRSNRTSVPPL